MGDDGALTRANILAEDDLHLVEVAVPEWPKCGGHVWVKGLSGAEAEELIGDNPASEGIKGKRAQLLVHTVCNEKGDLLFTSEDVEALNRKHTTVLDRIADAAMALNGLGVDTQERLAKNSEATLGADSGSP